ncbi:MAG: NADP-dependent oxidoreductase [Gemmatimonadota bacterium]|jgi:NADPH:quinone reductase-like Zn-dependent oxidoreductase
MSTRDIPETMKAAALDRFGGPEELTLHDVAVPELGPDELLVHVHTAGVGVWDRSEREGRMADWRDSEPSFPYVLGSDGAGTVVATGAEVSRFEEGDRVYGAAFLSPKGGFYAEYTAVQEDQAAPVPEGLELEEAGALAIDAATALRGLRDALDIQNGETVLIFGASGGVGHLAVQLAHRMGAKVLAVASGSDGVDFVEQLDAEEVVDGHAGGIEEATARIAPNGLDAALITTAGEGLEAALEGLHEGARVAWPNGVRPEPEVPEGVSGSAYDGRTDREIFEELNRLLRSGPFTVHVDRTYPLENAAVAHRALNDHYLGKLALHIEA